MCKIVSKHRFLHVVLSKTRQMPVFCFRRQPRYLGDDLSSLSKKHRKKKQRFLRFHSKHPNCSVLDEFCPWCCKIIMANPNVFSSQGTTMPLNTKFLDVFGSLKPFFGSYNRVFLYRLDLYGRCDFPKWSVYGMSYWRRQRQRKLRKRRRLLWAAMFFRLRQGQSPQRRKIYIEYIHKYLIWLIKAYCPENRNWEIKAESSLFSLGIPVMTLFCEPQSVGTQRKICGRILLDSRPLCLRHLAWSGKKHSSS